MEDITIQTSRKSLYSSLAPFFASDHFALVVHGKKNSDHRLKQANATIHPQQVIPQGFSDSDDEFLGGDAVADSCVKVPDPSLHRLCSCWFIFSVLYRSLDIDKLGFVIFEYSANELVDVSDDLSEADN